MKQGNLTIELSPYQIEYSTIPVKSHKNDGHWTRRLVTNFDQNDLLIPGCSKFLTVCPDCKWESHFGVLGKNVLGQQFKTLYLKGKAWHWEKPISCQWECKSPIFWCPLNITKLLTDKELSLLDNLCGKLKLLKHLMATELFI